MANLSTLYKQTSTGATQIWRQEISDDGASYRTVSGQIDGKQVTSAWKACKGKNIGKSNETTDAQQCLLEVESNYVKKLAQGGYHKAIDDIESRKFFQPMLAKDWHNYKTNVGYSQPKLDGIRCIMDKYGMWTRAGKALVSAPHIHDAFSNFFEQYPDVIFDGELYADKLVDDFQKIISLARQTKPTQEDLDESAKYLELHVYDLPSFDGRFGKRNASLRAIYDSFNDHQKSVMKLVSTAGITTEDEMDELYADYMENGYEGQIIRTDDTKYENKRSKQLLKRKVFTDAEFELVDIVEGRGNWAGYAKSMVIRLKNGTTQSTGLRGTQAFTKELLENKDKYIGGDVTVRYIRLTNDGKLFHPVTVAVYGSKRDI
jgi:DNA ligase-1